MITPRVLLTTGGAGFIGSNFVHYCQGQYSKGQYSKGQYSEICVLDALTYAGNRATLGDLEGQDGFHLIEGNICDAGLVAQILAAHQIDTVVHFAAESHVDRSISGPAAFVQTNVVGTFTLLEAFRHHWQERGKP
ncbi:MAG: NAD-dependent epimerase/dehydratase family protein, partial [Leptolyngbyaceae cyanobacterium SM1_4_3]|nr:NAD-dependent epimerase/dehydratase family protein [Leptolyngbyaceae cyanobacterium SM1_4_3]